MKAATTQTDFARATGARLFERAKRTGTDLTLPLPVRPLLWPRVWLAALAGFSLGALVGTLIFIGVFGG